MSKYLVARALATVAALVALTGCSPDDSSGGDTGGGGTSGATGGSDTGTAAGDTSGDTSGDGGSDGDTSVDSASGEIACPVAPFRHVLEGPGWLATAIDACYADASTERSAGLLIKNEYPSLLVVTPLNTSTTVSSVEAGRAVEGLRDSIHYDLARENSYPGWYLVPPGGYVVAGASSSELINVDIRVPVEAAAQAYVAGLFAQYIESKITSSPEKHAKAAVACAKEAAEFWDQNPPSEHVDPRVLLAQLSLGPAVSCTRLVRDIAAEADAPPPRQSALVGELRTVETELKVTVWDDLRGWARQGLKVCASLSRC